MYPNNRLRKYPAKSKKVAAPKGLFVIALTILAAIAAGAFFLTQMRAEQTHSGNKKASAPLFDKQQFSLSDPASPWIVVNKKRPLDPKKYTPADLTTPNIPLGLAASDPGVQLRAEAASALEKLAAGAKVDNVNLLLLSAYRSHGLQAITYDSEVKGYGQAQADRESARPGHSEHQTGWAVDLGAASGKCRIQACFGYMAEGIWLAQNAYKYGFILRYTPDKEPITGYNYEPWHLRYIGPDLATQMHKTNVKTLEEFFGLPAAPTY